MPKIINMPGSLLLAGLFLLTVILVYCVRYYACRYLLDRPNHRSSHQQPTPRGGGLACVITFLLGIGYLCLDGRRMLPELYLTVIGLVPALVGFFDDHGHVDARWRLLIYALASASAVWVLQGLPKLLLPLGLGWLDLTGFGYGLGVLFLVWSLNLFNFMDGIDGIAALEAVFVAFCLAWFMHSINADLALFALCLAAVCAGFLVWNWPPAKIFMGDVGSCFIGFMLGVLILLFSQIYSVFVYVGLILFAVFVVDASVTLLWRMITGQKWYEAHCSHAYQQLARSYPVHGHLRVVLGMTVINVGYLFPLAFLAFKLPALAWLCLLVAYAPLVFLAFRLKAGGQINNTLL